jgi:hypothetical protein
LGGGVDEAGIVSGQESIEVPLRLGQGARVRKVQLDDEPVLEGSEVAFHPPLRPGRGRWDPLPDRCPILTYSHMVM